MLRQSSTADHYVFMLQAKFIEAKDLPKMDLNGKADPFCVVKLGGIEQGRTRIIKRTRTPVWNETIKVPILESQKNYNLEIEVWDWDKVSSNDFIGTATVDLATLQDLKEQNKWIKITNESKKKPRGELHLSLHFCTKKEVEAEFWEDIYSHFDSDGSGSLGMMELIGLLEGIGASIPDEDVARLFKTLDENQDGEISFQELLHLVTDENRRADPLARQLFPADPNFIWSICSHTHDGKKVGEIVLQSHGVEFHKRTHEVEHAHETKTKELKIMVQDRETGKLVEEKIPSYIRVAMRMMYSTGGGLHMVEGNRVKHILASLTQKQGKKYNDPDSVKEIEHFIQFYQLDTDEMLDKVSSFKNFNEFFYRKLKPGARTIIEKDDPAVAVSPADCRLHVFETVAGSIELWIKGRNFSLRSLLQNDDLANKFEGGSLVIARLAPQDYHRFHFPICGVISEPTHIDGSYYTVNPVAVNQHVDVYSENKRCVATIASKEFGTVCFIAIGATMVGAISLTAAPGAVVQKGDEYGYFAFGGSTCILLFEKGRIAFDEDLSVNSQKPLETLVRMGSSIGRAL